MTVIIHEKIQIGIFVDAEKYTDINIKMRIKNFAIFRRTVKMLKLFKALMVLLNGEIPFNNSNDFLIQIHFFLMNIPNKMKL